MWREPVRAGLHPDQSWRKETCVSTRPEHLRVEDVVQKLLLRACQQRRVLVSWRKSEAEEGREIQELEQRWIMSIPPSNGERSCCWMEEEEKEEEEANKVEEEEQEEEEEEEVKEKEEKEVGEEKEVDFPCSTSLPAEQK